MRLVQRAQERRRVLLEGGGGVFQRGLVVAGQFCADLFLAGQRARPLFRHAEGRRFHAARHAFQQGGLRRGLRGDVAHGPRQGFTDLLLAGGGLRARLFPFLAQRGAHGAQRFGPGGQTLLVARCQFRLQRGVRLVQGAKQRRGMLLEAGGRGGQGLQVVAGQLFAGLFLARQRAGPGVGHRAGRGFQAGGDAVQQGG
ncbi:hypothetical protein D3C85_743030 [compost metagenome]